MDDLIVELDAAHSFITEAVGLCKNPAFIEELSIIANRIEYVFGLAEKGKLNKEAYVSLGQIQDDLIRYTELIKQKSVQSLLLEAANALESAMDVIDSQQQPPRQPPRSNPLPLALGAMSTNPAWVLDHDIWEKAENAAIDEYGMNHPNLYAIITTLYKKMGGRIAKGNNHSKRKNPVEVCDKATHESFKKDLATFKEHTIIIGKLGDELLLGNCKICRSTLGFELNQAEPRENPSWVRDHNIWEAAKNKVDPKKYLSPDAYWAVVTTVYKKLGGRVLHNR